MTDPPDLSIAEAKCWTHNFGAELHSDGELATYGVMQVCEICTSMLGAIVRLADDFDPDGDTDDD